MAVRWPRLCRGPQLGVIVAEGTCGGELMRYVLLTFLRRMLGQRLKHVASSQLGSIFRMRRLNQSIKNLRSHSAVIANINGKPTLILFTNFPANLKATLPGSKMRPSHIKLLKERFNMDGQEAFRRGFANLSIAADEVEPANTN